MTDVETIAKGLIPLEREWITGWQGPPGAAYNVIGEDLQSSGLLDSNWNLTALGKKVAAHLSESQS